MLLELLATGNWVLVNDLGQNIVKGGRFTMKDPVTGIKLCFDLFIVSRELLQFVKRLLFVRSQELAVGRDIKQGKQYKVVKSKISPASGPSPACPGDRRRRRRIR